MDEIRIRFFDIVLLLGLVPTSTASQTQIPPATPAADRITSHERHVSLLAESPFKNVEFSSIGPTVMSGRIVDLDVSPHDPTHFYIAYASGGLWKTTSNGTSFTPLFEGQAAMTIGDIAVSWSDPEVVYVGTGENNSSRSSYSGTGIYRTSDGGKTWQHLGLEETHHVGRIIIDPSDKRTVFVAAIGHLYSKNPERGVYKSNDGGETWRHTLIIDDSTGVIDLVIDPNDTSILYAAAWHRQRKAWDLEEGGKTSGIFKSSDGGESWTRISTKKSGFPTGRGVGRIGLAVAPSDPSVVYAVVDNQALRDERDDDLPVLTFEHLQEMDSKAFAKKVTEADLGEYLEYHEFPDRYDAETVTAMIEVGEIEPADLVTYLDDENQALFDGSVVGCEVYRSNDAGAVWWRTHHEYLDDTCRTYGYYFGNIWVTPQDPDEVYVAGVPLLKSTDGGESWENIGRENVHADHHALWLNPERSAHLINGNDGGLNMSYDGGETWLKLNTPTVGQFYTVNFDNEDPYNVYGGLQDNGVWVGPSGYQDGVKWHSSGRYPYQQLLGGDGMMVEIDPRNSDIVYAGFQFGYYFRLDRGEDEKTKIRPQHDLGDEPFRFNWLTPIQLSKHNPDILYLGSNMVHRSMDGGDTWITISDDLTRGSVEGDVPFGTLSSLAESPLRFGLIYAGSDDGLVHVSLDGGASWDRVAEDLPQHMWVSRIEPSSHVESRVYLALNGYRWDHMDSYVYVSDDYGTTWDRIGPHLPLGPVNVIREDPLNPKVLYVGTDHGVFVSIDSGDSFSPMGSGIPGSPVHDLRIHPRERDLIAATHGRSIYVADVAPIQDLDEETLGLPLFVFEIDSVEFKENWGDRSNNWKDPVEPEVEIGFYAAESGQGRVFVIDEFDHVMSEFEVEAENGLNFLSFDLATCQSSLKKHQKSVRSQAADNGEEKEMTQNDASNLEPRDNGKVYLPTGTYSIKIKLNGAVDKTELVIK